MSTCLKVAGLSLQTTQNQPILQNLSFEVQPGEIYALAGESGSGKSMTALALMRLLPPGIHITAGAVNLQAQDMLLWTEQRMQTARGRSLSMIFQEPMLSLNPVMTIQSQLMENVPKDVTVETVKSILKTVHLNQVETLLKQYPHELSGGMKQRIMIAMALLRRPKILIADEPTTALDVTTQAAILKLLKSIAKTYDMSVIFITHDMGVIHQMADRVGILYQGRLVEQGPVKSVIHQPKHPYTQALLSALPAQFKRHEKIPMIHLKNEKALGPGCAFLNRCQHAQSICEQQCPTWTDGVRCFVQPPYPLKQTQSSEARLPQSTDNPVMLDIKGLSKAFVKKNWLGRVVAQHHAVKNLNAQVREGETLAIVGESGSGKSTTAQLIMQLLSEDAGEIQLWGQSIRKNRSKHQYYQHVQMVFQDAYSSMNPKMTIEHIVLEGVKVLNPAVLDNNPNYLEGLLEKVGLTPSFKHRYPHECSGGQRQRIAIARALSVQPKLIVFDEPTSALDVSTQAQILNLITDLQQQEKLSYIFITHDLAVARHVSDWMVVMQSGVVVESGPTEHVFNHPKAAYTQKLLSAICTIP